MPSTTTIPGVAAPKPNGSRAVIEVENLMRKFGEFTAVDNISFAVPEGSIFGFLGPNGAGKTTTIKMLTTILRPTSGSIKVDGHDPLHEQHNVRSSFGIVFQDPSLDGDLTAQENLDLHGVMYHIPPAQRRQRIDELLALVELSDRRGDFVKTYSGGMKRRLEIARALLHIPKVLFLDEPTLGLDPQTRNHIWDYIRKLNRDQGISVFFTTHYMDEADRVADEIAVIDQGKIIAQGGPAELKENTGAATLEEAFITLTGRAIREESGNNIDRLRNMAKVWKR
jgi:ABC-2 type transport system ATP-binding protein